jgi:hypothetical protein
VCSVFFSKVSVFLKVTFFNVGIKDYDVISQNRRKINRGVKIGYGALNILFSKD